MKRTDLCAGWLFCAKGGQPRPVTLPHDAMQEQGRSPNAPSGQGEAFFLGGYYIYEKQFAAPAEWQDQDVFVEFEGVMPTAKVFLNGEEIGGCAYGYSRFRVALTGLVAGGENTLRVEVDDTQKPISRWYPGAGIHRPVWLLAGNKAHIAPDGVRVTTLVL